MPRDAKIGATRNSYVYTLRLPDDLREQWQSYCQRNDKKAAEDKDEYLVDSVFWVPKEGRWSHAKRPEVGILIDGSVVHIEQGLYQVSSQSPLLVIDGP